MTRPRQLRKKLITGGGNDPAVRRALNEAAKEKGLPPPFNRHQDVKNDVVAVEDAI